MTLHDEEGLIIAEGTEEQVMDCLEQQEPGEYEISTARHVVLLMKEQSIKVLDAWAL